MYIRKLFRCIISLPKTVYFNFSVLGFREAIKLPFYVDADVRLGKLYKNVVRFMYQPKRFDIKLGIRTIDGVPEYTKGYISFSKQSKIILNGNAEFSYGITLVTLNDGIISVGRNFFCNKNCSIVSRDSIYLGNDVLMGWNVSIRDSDGETHRIYNSGIPAMNHKPINVSDHVWICACSHILKGVSLARDTVVAYNSCVTKSFSESNIILAGCPACIIKTNIDWSR